MEQPEVLTHRLQAAGVRHGQEGTVDLSEVRVYAAPTLRSRIDIRMCSVWVENVQTAGRGDNRSWPATVEVVGVEKLPNQDGWATFHGARFSINGRVELDLTDAVIDFRDDQVLHPA